MYTHTQMNRKEPMIKPEACRIVDIKELPASRFEEFRKNLLNDYDFISDVAEDLHGGEEATDCLLVLGEGYPYGILVNSEGSAYARYSGIMPHARQVVEAHLNKLADYCVEEGISNTEDGKWTITYDELYEHFGTVVTPSNGWGEMLLAKLKLQDEVDAVIATEDEFEMDYHLEYCEQCQEGGIEGAMSLMSLMGCNLLDVHLQNDDGKGSKQFIPELEPSTLSEDGKREFADVLQAKIILMKDDTITVQGVPMERIKRFSDVLCQNCTMEDYHKFIAPKSGEVRTEYATITQDMVDIASAKHTLWRLDQDEGKQAVFSHCDFYKLNFEGKDFNGAIFEDCRFYDCRAKQGEFCFASFARSKLDDCSFEDAYLEGAIFRQADILTGSFKYAELSGSDFSGAHFDYTDVDNARMRDCNFTDTDFHETYIEGADTEGSVYSQEEWDHTGGHEIMQ